MVLQGNRKVWALGPGVALGLIDLCGAQYSPTGGQATHTVDLTLQENKIFPNIFQYFPKFSHLELGAGVELSGLVHGLQSLPTAVSFIEGEGRTKDIFRNN